MLDKKIINLKATTTKRYYNNNTTNLPQKIHENYILPQNTLNLLKINKII